MNKSGPSSSDEPQGDDPHARERARLLQLIRELSLKRGHFVLSSGAVSDYYLDLRLTTTHPEGAILSARMLLREAERLGADRIGGPTLGADPLVGAAVALSWIDPGTLEPRARDANEPSPNLLPGEPPAEVRGFIVRSQTKDHGTGRLIEGHLGSGHRALVFDDVVTAGGSILKAVESVRAAGAEVTGTWCLVDRGQGGREKLLAAAAPLSAVFQVEEILSAESAIDPTSEIDPTASPAPSGRLSRPRTPALTVDAILELAPRKILLVERRFPPRGWALPGGFVEIGETVEEAVAREIREETGLVIEEARQMHTYSSPGRDPRLHTTSVVFVARTRGTAAAGSDSKDVRLFSLDALPPDLCFDHGQILNDFRAARHGIGPGQLLGKVV